jgi:hypothetical protein
MLKLKSQLKLNYIVDRFVVMVKNMSMPAMMEILSMVMAVVLTVKFKMDGVVMEVVHHLEASVLKELQVEASLLLKEQFKIQVEFIKE